MIVAHAKEVYEVTLVRPEGVSVKELSAYIKNAVDSWGGAFDPHDPLYLPWSRGSYFKGVLPAIRVKRQRF